MGAISDTASRRTILVVCTLGGMVGYQILTLTTSLLGVVISRIVVGVFRQYSTVTKAIVCELSSPADRTAAVGA